SGLFQNRQDIPGALPEVEPGSDRQPEHPLLPTSAQQSPPLRSLPALPEGPSSEECSGFLSMSSLRFHHSCRPGVGSGSTSLFCREPSTGEARMLQESARDIPQGADTEAS